LFHELFDLFVVFFGLFSIFEDDVDLILENYHVIQFHDL